MNGVLAAAVTFAAVALAKPETGYIVTGKINGHSAGSPQWGYAIARQTTSFTLHQEVILDQLIDIQSQPAPSAAYAAFDPVSRQYLAAAVANSANANVTVWAQVIAHDVNSTTPFQPFGVSFAPGTNDILVGLEALNLKGSVIVVAVFQSGAVWQVNLATGAVQPVASLVNSTRRVTQAITVDATNAVLYAISESAGLSPAREIVALSADGWAVSSVVIQPLKEHIEDSESPFEMVWLPTMAQLLVFYTGGFDQIIFLDPLNGVLAFGAFDLADFQGETGDFQFLVDTKDEMDDLWTDACYDGGNRVYFQCSEVDPQTDETVEEICFVVFGSTPKTFSGIGVAISPAALGYTGFQYVPVVAAAAAAAAAVAN